ncbi:MAG TPA: hypothetical protein VFS85_10655, partial [Dongiaceae bacterium]|nr:hypothetical protein [Dongiaceae bacterium]
MQQTVQDAGRAIAEAQAAQLHQRRASGDDKPRQHGPAAGLFRLVCARALVLLARDFVRWADGAQMLDVLGAARDRDRAAGKQRASSRDILPAQEALELGRRLRPGADVGEGRDQAACIRMGRA